ncbi:unnamed protein product [Sphagnum jensenii]|uniref:LOB domain-containing protein n=1 Tax=Sphagnum jensenii TaxID=128206 RepID=A0ABP0WIA1_9BRYO
MSPCAACKLLRRRCAKGCVFAPYFPPDDPQKFANVHKVFGASNVNKMLKDLPVHQRGDAVSSMVYEANARVRDPVYGCVGAISSLQQQVIHLQSQLTVANAKILSMQMHNQSSHAGPNDEASFFFLAPNVFYNKGNAPTKIFSKEPTPINAPCKMDSMWT